MNYPWINLLNQRNKLAYLHLKRPIMTAADDKFETSIKIKLDISFHMK